MHQPWNAESSVYTSVSEHTNYVGLLTTRTDSTEPQIFRHTKWKYTFIKGVRKYQWSLLLQYNTLKCRKKISHPFFVCLEWMTCGTDHFVQPQGLDVMFCSTCLAIGPIYSDITYIGKYYVCFLVIKEQTFNLQSAIRVQWWVIMCSQGSSYADIHDSTQMIVACWDEKWDQYFGVQD